MGLGKMLGIKSKFCVDCERKLPFSLNGQHDDIIEYKDGLRCLECAKIRSKQSKKKEEK